MPKHLKVIASIGVVFALLGVAGAAVRIFLNAAAGEGPTSSLHIYALARDFSLAVAFLLILRRRGTLVPVILFFLALDIVIKVVGALSAGAISNIAMATGVIQGGLLLFLFFYFRRPDVRGAIGSRRHDGEGA